MLHVFNLRNPNSSLHTETLDFQFQSIRFNSPPIGSGSELKMSNLRTICRPHAVFTSFICCRHQARFSSRVSFQRNPNHSPSLSPASSSDFVRLNRSESWFRANQRRSMIRASNWTHPKSPYETLGNWVLVLIEV